MSWPFESVHNMLLQNESPLYFNVPKVLYGIKFKSWYSTQHGGDTYSLSNADSQSYMSDSTIASRRPAQKLGAPRVCLIQKVKFEAH